MKKLMVGMAVLSWALGASAGEKVWQYVDARTGEVSYSNVQIKGKKPVKQVEIMDYPNVPPALSSTPAAGAQGAPIPAEVLRQIQAGQAGAGGPLPMRLPPLPSGGAAAPSQAPAAAPAQPPASQQAPSRPWAVKPANSASAEPKWAKEVAASSQAPLWAQDPFEPGSE